MNIVLAYIGAAIAEIAGCFSFWAWLRLGKSAWWLVPGQLSLTLFAYLLTLIESNAAGRIYAAYGGVYIVASIGWLWIAEGIKPQWLDIIGGGICLIGTMVILYGARHH
jgi:small multidrug resistance family-3 protein